MKYQKILLNILIIFFLFFTLSIQAKGDVKKELGVRSKILDIPINAKDTKVDSAIVTGLDASLSPEVVKELTKVIANAKDAGDIAKGLDRLINVLKVSNSAYNHDLYGTVKNIIDAHASTFLASSASALAMAAIGLFTVSNPLTIGGGIIVGIGTAVAYTKIDPVKIVVDGVLYESYNDIYNNAEASLRSCDLNNANKQINIATKGWLILLDKSKAKCISIEAKRSDYMAKNNIKGLKDTVLFSDQEMEMLTYSRNLASAESEKKEHSDFLVKLLKFKRDFRKKNEEFNLFRGHYIQQILNIKNASSKDEACRKYNLLRIQNKCEQVFLETSAPSLREEKKKLTIEMNSQNHQLSLDRWNTLENLYEKLQCSNLDSIQKELIDFEEIVNKNTIKVYDELRCYSPNQNTFHNKLNDLKAEWQEKKYECNQTVKDKDAKDNNKTLDQIVYRIEGAGYTPHWGGGSYYKMGYANVLVTVKDPDKEAYIQKIRDQAIKSPCDLKAIPLDPGFKTSPAIWEIGPKITIINESTSDLTSEENKNGWEIKNSDSPSLSELWEESGCKK